MRVKLCYLIIEQMNWFIFSTSENKNDYKTLITGYDKSADIFMWSAGGGLDALTQCLGKADCCIVTDVPLECRAEYSYAVGFALGRKLPLYAVSDKINADSTLRGFKDCRSLFEYFKISFDEVYAKTRKQNAYRTLFENGMPFTPDCLAMNIALNREDVCRQYLEAGMDVNSLDCSGTPMLNIAVRNDRKECTAWLIDNGADINAASRDRGYTALMDAVWRGNYDIAKLLLDKGAAVNTVNKEGQTMLVLAVGAGKERLCSLLVEHGESPDIKDAMGMSAYEYAKLFKKDSIAAILEKYHKS